MSNIEDIGMPALTEEIQAKKIVIDDDLYFEIASRAMAGLLANPALRASADANDPGSVPKALSLMACDCTDCLIEEAISRMENIYD